MLESSAYTDAYYRADIAWITKTLRHQLWLFVLVCIGVILLVLMAKPVIALWVGKEVVVSTPLVVAMGAFALISVWNNVFGAILGGINKIRLGSMYTVLTAVINIPISYFFAVILQYGSTGIIMGTIASIFISALISPIQVYYFIYTNQSNKFLSRVLR